MILNREREIGVLRGEKEIDRLIDFNGMSIYQSLFYV